MMKNLMIYAQTIETNTYDAKMHNVKFALPKSASRNKFSFVGDSLLLFTCIKKIVKIKNHSN